MDAKGAHVVFHRMINSRPVRNDETNTNKVEMIRAVLLCKRTTDAPTHPGLWSLFGGVIEDGESPKDAVCREIDEELESSKLNNIFDLEPLTEVRVSRRSGSCLISYFESPLCSDMDDLKLKRHAKSIKVEGEGLAWFTAEEIHHLPMRPEDRIAVNEFFKKHGV